MNDDENHKVFESLLEFNLFGLVCVYLNHCTIPYRMKFNSIPFNSIQFNSSIIPINAS